ncbi:hypothetical protein C0992_001766, partial [Termitomyces sp. T32_za158]
AYYPSIETSILIKLLASVDFHPLSINLLAQAAVQNEWSAQDLVTAWDHQRTSLLETGDRKLQSIAVTMETSLNSPSFVKLGKMVYHLLQLIAFLPQGISKTHLTSIFPEVSNIETCADALCRQSIAYLNGDFITLLAPIRLYIISCFTGSNISANPFLGQVRSHYAAHVKDARIVGQENVNIEHVLAHWLMAPETTVDVLTSTAEFVHTLFFYCCRSISLHTVISGLKTSKSQYSVPYMEFSVWTSIFQMSKASHAKFHCLLAISQLEHVLGQVKEAEETLTEAWALLPFYGKQSLLAFKRYSLATIYYKQGNYLVAEYTLQKALKKLSCVSAVFVHGIKNARRSIRIALARLYMIRGLPDSFRAYLDALPVLRKERYRRYVGSIHTTAGFIELHHNHLDIAKNCFKEMQSGIDKDEPDWLMGSLGLAEVADQQHDYAESKALRLQLLESVQRVPDQTIEYVNELTALCAGYLALEGHVEQAQKLILSAIRNASNSLPLNVIKCKYLAGMIELAGGDYNEAEKYFCKAIEDCILFTELLYHARSHRALGEIFMVQQDMVGARHHFDATTELCRAMGLPRERLYFDYACCIPSKNYNGWKLYQEGGVPMREI